PPPPTARWKPRPAARDATTGSAAPISTTRPTGRRSRTDGPREPAVLGADVPTPGTTAPEAGRAGGIVLAALLAAHLALGVLFAIRTPAWEVPDEPAHYNYLAELVARGRIPVIEAGEHDQAAEDEIIFAKRFASGVSIERFRYEDWQPPAYYLAAAPVFVLCGGALMPLRLFSALLGCGIVALAWLIARELAPGRPELAAGTAAFVAFLPQHLAILAGFNNDVAAELVLAGCVYALLRRERCGFESMAPGATRGSAP